MDNQNEKDRCVNCGIRSVPLYLGWTIVNKVDRRREKNQKRSSN